MRSCVYGIAASSTVGLSAWQTPLVIPRTTASLCTWVQTRYQQESTRTPARTGTADYRGSLNSSALGAA
jgi:hypothetical protein